MVRLANSTLLPQLLNHFSNQSVAEVVAKLLEAETEKDFFEGEKLEIIAGLCGRLAAEKDEGRVEAAAESFAGFIESLVEKHEDKYEKAKYAKLIRSVLDRSDLFLFLFQQFDAHPHRPSLQLHLLRSIEAFLRIHLPPKQTSKISEEEGAPEAYTLKESFSEGLKNWLCSHMVHEFVSGSRTSHPIEAYNCWPTTGWSRLRLLRSQP